MATMTLDQCQCDSLKNYESCFIGDVMQLCSDSIVIALMGKMVVMTIMAVMTKMAVMTIMAVMTKMAVMIMMAEIISLTYWTCLKGLELEP